MRTTYEEKPTVIPAVQWDFKDESGKAVVLMPKGTAFKQGSLYTFVYQAKDPLVGGLGFAALRDVGFGFNMLTSHIVARRGNTPTIVPAA